MTVYAEKTARLLADLATAQRSGPAAVGLAKNTSNLFRDRGRKQAPRIDLGHFDLAPFLLQFSVVAGYQISWAIYVSDYSRYLPPDVTVSKTFWWTYGGSGLGALWIMAIGSGLAAWAGKEFDTIPSLQAAGDRVFTGFGAIILIFYFMIIRPQQKRMKQQQALINSVKRGDKVVLSNGMHGSVHEVEEKTVLVEIARNTVVRFEKAAIQTVNSGESTTPATT